MRSTATSFISAIGITPERGLSTAQRNIADVLAVRRASRRTVALIDSSKYGTQSLLPVARLDELDAVIVDDELPDQAERSATRAPTRHRRRARDGGPVDQRP